MEVARRLQAARVGVLQEGGLSCLGLVMMIIVMF
jgi:hypothetical protein